MDKVIVVAAVIEKDGSWLLCRRASHKTHAGLWEFPGGKVHEGESVQEALVREVREELNLTIQAGESVAFSQTRVNNTTLDLFALRAELKQEFPANLKSTDHDEWRWVRPVELVSLPMTSAEMGLIPQLLKQKEEHGKAVALESTTALEMKMESGLPLSNISTPSFVSVNDSRVWEMQSISPWSTAKLFGAMNGFLGIFMGLGMLWFGWFLEVPIAGASRAIVAAIVPLMNIFAGLFVGFVFAIVYNITASIVGGVRINLKVFSNLQ